MSPERVFVREEGEGRSMQMDQKQKKRHGNQQWRVWWIALITLVWSAVLMQNSTHCWCNKREQTTCRAFKISAVIVCSDEVHHKKKKSWLKQSLMCVCFTEVSKWSIRKKIWDHLEENDLVNFPRPCNNRIPNFVVSTGADQAREVGFSNSSITWLLLIDGNFWSATNYSALQWC